MSRITDQQYLRDEQYRDASNLNARIDLHRRFSANPYGWHVWVFDQIDLPARCRMLELGCGPGDLWTHNLPRIPAGWSITLSDLSPGMLDRARRSLSGSRPFHFAIADAQCIPCHDASFDAVIANHILYHVPDRSRAFADIHRVLAPGGRLIAATNGRAHMLEMDALARRVDPGWEDWSALDADFFTLERGLEELPRRFADVTARRYADALVITEAAPMIAYLMSGSRRSRLADRQAALARLVQAELDAHGAIRVTKDAGLLIATKRASQ